MPAALIPPLCTCWSIRRCCPLRAREDAEAELGPRNKCPSPRGTNAPHSSALWVTTCHDLVHRWLPGGSGSSRTWPCPDQITRGCIPKMHSLESSLLGSAYSQPFLPLLQERARRATLLASLEKCEQDGLCPHAALPLHLQLQLRRGRGPGTGFCPLPSTPTHLPSFRVSGSPDGLGSSLITAPVALMREPGLCLHLFSSPCAPASLPVQLRKLTTGASGLWSESPVFTTVGKAVLGILSCGSWSETPGGGRSAPPHMWLCGSGGQELGVKTASLWWVCVGVQITPSLPTPHTWAVGAAQHIPDQPPKSQWGQAL